MSLNHISTLTFKADRQLAKLTIAKAKREGRVVESDGSITGDIDPTKPYFRERNTYDISELPTVYTAGDNDTNNVTDNPNPSGLVYGRPWVIYAVEVGVTAEDGVELTTEDGVIIIA